MNNTNHNPKSVELCLNRVRFLFQWIENNKRLPKQTTKDKKEKSLHKLILNLRQAKRGSNDRIWVPEIEEILKNKYPNIKQDLFEQPGIKKGKDNHKSISYNYDLIHKDGRIRKGPIECVMNVVIELNINYSRLARILRQYKQLNENIVPKGNMVRSVSGWSVKGICDEIR